MIVVPLAQYLSEFEEDEIKPFRPQESARSARPAQPPFERLTLVQGQAGMKKGEDRADPAAIAPEEPAVDHAGELQAAVAAAREAALAEGRAAMKAELEAAHAQALRSERERAASDHAEAMKAARAAWVETQSGSLATEFHDRLHRMETAIRSTLTGVLRPLAADARQRQTLAQLVEAIDTLMLDGKAFTIRATGPGDLLSALADKLGPRRDLVTCETDESAVEIRIKADRTVIETRLSSWGAALEEALA